jgi:hypothetical protein
MGTPSSHNRNRNRPYSESWDPDWMETDSDDEKLDVYKASIEFVGCHPLRQGYGGQEG